MQFPSPGTAWLRLCSAGGLAGWASLSSHPRAGIQAWVHPRHHQGQSTFPWKNNLQSFMVAEKQSLLPLLGSASCVPPLHPAGTPGQDEAAWACTGPADGCLAGGKAWSLSYTHRCEHRLEGTTGSIQRRAAGQGDRKSDSSIGVGVTETIQKTSGTRVQ